MANEKKDKQVKRPSAEKRNIQSKKRNLCNRALKARVKKMLSPFKKNSMKFIA